MHGFEDRGSKGHFSTNKTQYDWFPGKSQSSIPTSAQCWGLSAVAQLNKNIKNGGGRTQSCKNLMIKNLKTSKNHCHRGFQHYWGLKCPLGVTKNFLAQNNIKNEFSTIKLLRVQIFSKIAIIGGIFNIFWQKWPPRGKLEFFNTQH